MPGLVDQPQVLAVRQFFNQSSGTFLNTRQYFKYTGTAPSNAVCATIADDFYNLAVTEFLPLMTASVGLNKCTVTDLTSPTSGYGEADHAAGGTRSGNPLPAGTCALLSCKIERRYRGGKPRVYYPFGADTDLATDRTWASGFAGSFATAIAAYINGALAIVESGTTVAQFVNVSYYSGFVSVENPVTHRWRNVPMPRAVAIPPDPIIAYSLNPNLASQRRRNLIV